MSKDGFVTPEELDALAESCAKRVEDYVLHDLITVPTPKEIIRSAISQALLLQRESVIEELIKAVSVLDKPAHTYASENADLYRGFDNGVDACLKILRALKG